MTDCRQLRFAAHDAVDHFYYTGQDKVPQGIPAAVVDSSIIQIPPETFFNCTQLEQADIYGHNLRIIGAAAFKRCHSMKTVQLPQSVERIEERAFSACVSLTRIGTYPSKKHSQNKISHSNPTLPLSLTFLGPAAFHYCKSLTSISIPSTVETIQEYTFFYCEALVDVNLMKGLKVIEERAFQGCISLQTIAIPSTVERIGKYAFFYCIALAEATISNQLTQIAARSFYDCKALKAANMQHTAIQGIGENCYYFCEALLQVDFPCTLQKIHRSAFESCISLKAVAIPPSVTTIEQGAFRGCRSLVAVEFSNGLEWIMSKAFADCDSLRMIALPKHSERGEYTKNAFSGCSILEGRCFGGDLLASLGQRFDKLPIHKICYNAGYTGATVEDLANLLVDNVWSSLEDACDFGMTPLHILATSAKPRQDLFRLLLDRLPRYALSQKDNENYRPIDYLCQNESTAAANLMQMVLQRTMLDRMKDWGLARWRSELSVQIESLSLTKSTIISAFSKTEFLIKVECEMARYERLEILSLLELALWKIAISRKPSRYQNGQETESTSELQDRYSCRVRCGAETVIPNVQEFLVHESYIG